VVYAGLALGGVHGAVEHDGCDARATETPFDQLQHGGELGEDDGFRRHVLRAQFVEFVDQEFDLGGGRPVLHLDSVDDGRFLGHLLILFDFRLLEVDGEGNMAGGAVGDLEVIV
jgi:hypothetical protein